MEENNISAQGVSASDGENNLKNNSQKQIVSAILIAAVIIAGAILLKGGKPATAPVTKGPVESSPIFNQCLDTGKYIQAVADSTSGGGAAGVSSTPKGFILKNDKVVDMIDGAIPTNDIKAKLDAALALTSDTGTTNPNLRPVSSTDFIQGDSSAPVTLIEYADFQCPFCGRFFSETEKTLIDSYVKDGKIKFVYRDFTFLGQESKWAAQAARCAADQGKFWEYHDYLYNHQNGENQGAFTIANLKSFANTLGLN